jgi:hypothetical protein
VKNPGDKTDGAYFARGKERTPYKALVKKSDVMKPLEIDRRGLENNVKIYLKEIV